MIFDTKTLPEIYDSILAEIAKASNEIRCAKNDLAQAETRMKFVLATMHYLKNKDMKDK
jgi:hypothetical protein